MKKAIKILGFTLGGLVLVVLILVAAMYFSSYAPDELENEAVMCRTDVPVLRPGQRLKILVWNIQYFSGKNYTFFYDLPGGDGPDTRATPEDISKTFAEIARVILDENPDILMMQEFHDGALRTDHEDQLARLRRMLGDRYPCYAQTFYWRAPFVPHPRIMGAVGMKLATLARFRMTRAVRHALPPIPANFFFERMGFHRAVLEVRLPVQNANDFSVLNTHLDAFAEGTNTMDQQVALVKKLLTNLNNQGRAWILGGDFNLLPPDFPRSNLLKEARVFYNKRAEITPLFEAFQSTATREMLAGPNRARYYTYFSNNPRINIPDRTIDYIFYSRRLRLHGYRVRQKDTMKISDHFPLIAVIQLP